MTRDELMRFVADLEKVVEVNEKTWNRKLACLRSCMAVNEITK